MFRTPCAAAEAFEGTTVTSNAREQRRNERRHADPEGRENDVEADGERELQPGKEQRLAFHQGIPAPPNGRRRPPLMGDSGVGWISRKLLFMKHKELIPPGTPAAVSTPIARLLEYRPKPREIS